MEHIVALCKKISETHVMETYDLPYWLSLTPRLKEPTERPSTRELIEQLKKILDKDTHVSDT